MAHSGSISHDDPDPLPAEIWSVFAQFPSYHKLTGSLAGGIHDTLAYQDCISYLQKKHNMHPHLQHTSMHCHAPTLGALMIVTNATFPS